MATCPKCGSDDPNMRWCSFAHHPKRAHRYIRHECTRCDNSDFHDPVKCPSCTICGTTMVAFDANGTALGTSHDPRIIAEYRCLSCGGTSGYADYRLGPIVERTRTVPSFVARAASSTPQTTPEKE